MRQHVLAISLLTAALVQSFSLPHIEPVDAATEDATLRDARDAALAAAKAKNVDALMALVSRDVIQSEGSDLRNPYRWLRDVLGNPQHEWWGGIVESLSLGGAFTTSHGAIEGRREFCAPYYYALFPSNLPGEVQGENAPWAIIDKNVALHAKPDARSRVVPVGDVLAPPSNEIPKVNSMPS